MTKEIRVLKRWLKQPGNNELILANILGYRSQESIKQWIKRGRVPHYRAKEVMEVCDVNR